MHSPGHLCGEAIIAHTATPERVLIGFSPRIFFNSLDLCFEKPRIVGFLGRSENLYFFERFAFSDSSSFFEQIFKFFEQDGEEVFRKIEKKCAKWLETNIKNTIISTGGGFYKQKNIKKIGTIIYLKSTFDKIIEGLKNAPNSKKKFKKRPILQDLKKAREIYKIRTKDYEKIADIIIDVSHWDEKKLLKI